jgi:hypothetical protein
MRRAITISLMMLSSWTLIAPPFAPDADANLSACCRRNGTHHCMMRMTVAAWFDTHDFGHLRTGADARKKGGTAEGR